MSSERAYQYPNSSASAVTDEARKIRDWLPWSIGNLFIGGLLIGLIPLSLSMGCRESKKRNDITSAKRKSTHALIANIVVTILGIALIIIVACVIAIY